MWSYSHPPTPGQQPSFVCYWDPEGAERAIRRKFEHISAHQPALVTCNNDTLCIVHNSMERNQQKLSDTPSEYQEYTDNNGRDFEDGTSYTIYEEGRSDASSPESQKASDESSLSGPSWRIQRGLGEFRCSADNVNSSRDEKICIHKEIEEKNCSTDADKLGDNYNKGLRPLFDTGSTEHLHSVKSLKVKHQEPDMCDDQFTAWPGRKYGQAFAQTNVQNRESNCLTALIDSEAEKTDYFGDVDLAPRPSNSGITSNIIPERPSILLCSSNSTNTLSSFSFKTDIFGKDTSVASRPEYRHCASISLLHREVRSEETEPFLEGYNPASTAPNFSIVADTAASGVSKKKRFFKPQIFRAPASAPIIKLRRNETAVVADIPRDSIGRNRRRPRRTIRSSESSDISVNPLDDVTSGSLPVTKEGIMRKYWTLGLRNPLLFPIYLGTSKRSRLFGNSLSSLSIDDQEFYDSSESQPRSELATPDSEHVSALETNDTNDYFRIRSNRLTTDDDDGDKEGGKPHIHIPDHLPNSPLCPLNAKYRGVHLAECPQHGRRRVSLSVLKM